jgi:hypothetical protein
MNELTFAEVATALEAGDMPLLSDIAQLHLSEMEEDHVTVVTAALGDRILPNFLVRLSKKSAKFCGASPEEGVPPPDVSYMAYHGRRGNTAVEMQLGFFDRERVLHLPLNPAHPFVLNWLLHSRHTSVFGVTYALPHTDQFFSWYGVRDDGHVAWFERNFKTAEALPTTNEIDDVVATRAAGLRDGHQHRFLAFDDISMPLLLSPHDPAIALIEEDEPVDYETDWLATTHGIPVTPLQDDELPDTFFEDLLTKALVVREQPRRYLQALQRISRDYPDHAAILRLLYHAAEDVDRSEHARYRKRITALKDRSLSHRLLFLEIQDNEDFLREMRKLPLPHSILDHPAEHADGHYAVSELITHEELAGRFESQNGQVGQAILRLDRLVRFGVEVEQLAPLMQRIIVSRMDTLDPERDTDKLMSYTDVPATIRRRLHPETLDLLREETENLFAALAEEAQQEPVVREGKKVGRNDPCPCGSGRKYKRCCLKK